MWVRILAIAIVIASLALLCGPARARSERVLIVPVETGGERLMTSAEITHLMQSAMQKQDASDEILTPSALALKNAFYDNLKQPPTIRAITSVTATYGCTSIVWVNMRFQSGFRVHATSVCGTARVWIWRGTPGGQFSDGDLFLDTSLTQTVTAATDPESSLQRHVMAQQCSRRLIRSMLALERRTTTPAQRAVPSPPTVQTRPVFKRMCRAIEAHTRADADNDLFATLAARNQALDCWFQLTPEEQARIEQRYPGTTAWMRGYNFPPTY